MTMRLDFTLDRQVITRIDSNCVVAGSKGYVTAHFTDVSGDWVEPVTAIFGAYTVLLEGMECAVPWEVLADPGAFEVSAFCGDLHTANTARVDVEATGYKKGETPGDPTPDVYAVLVEKARRAEEIAQSVRDDADAGHFDGEDGKTPVRGVDYWTPEDRKPIEDAMLDATTAADRADCHPRDLDATPYAVACGVVYNRYIDCRRSWRRVLMRAGLGAVNGWLC